MAPPADAVGTGPLARAGSLLLVVALVAGALWLDRARHDPVPAYGIVPGPGVAAIPEAGDIAPTFLLPAIDGEIVALADRRGEVVVLHFWTSWCLECRAAVPALSELAAGGGVTVLGIGAGEPMSRIETAADDLGATYPVLVDAEGEVARAYGISEDAYPVTVVIDAEGVIRAISPGPVSVDALAEQVAAARAAP